MAVIEQAVPAGVWNADPVHSSATFEVKHLGLSTFRAHFSDFEAVLSANDGEAGLVGQVKAESISVSQPDFRAHLLSPEFFDAESHPEIRFESKSILTDDGGGLVVQGALTINGHNEIVEARGAVGEQGGDPYGGERVGLVLETVVDRRKFGIDWNADLPGGKQALANDVRLLVELELVKGE